jgi:hypothetical protein
MSVSATFTGQTAGELAQFIHEQRARLKPFRRVLVNREGSRIIDLNRNELHFPGITWGHALLEPLLREAGAAFDPTTLNEPPPNPQASREFGCTARYPWAQDRIL